MNPRAFLFIYPRVRYCARHLCITSTLRNQAKQQQENKTSWIEKLTYSSYLEQFTIRPTFRERMREPYRKLKEEVKELKRAKRKSHSVALQYFSSDPDLMKQLEKNEDKEDSFDKLVEGEGDDPNMQFPYKIYTKFEHTEDSSDEVKREDTKTGDSEEHTPADEWMQKYGIPDPSVPASSVPCGGCGAFLHCQDTAIPGYMPSERFKELTDEELKAEICQRCFFLKAHDAALNVNVSPKIYPEILKSIQNKKALVLLVVDLVDFPCSIWPGIARIIGEKRPVILVGNKVDLIPRDSKKYLEHVKQCLRCAAEDVGLDKTKIIDVALVSAATGYGVEELITTIFAKWAHKGDIYIMGCTNVGKSTLFNVFLQSDLCKVQAVDLIQRATVSAWPGTTLNLLKFPILQPDGWKLHLRASRLKSWSEEIRAEKKLREFQLKETHNPAYANLIGYVGRSFTKTESEAEMHWLNSTQDVFQVNPRSFNLPKLTQVGKWDPHDPAFAHGRWCYDTPGTINENQILDKLLLPELMKVLPKKMLQPRSYYIKPDLTMFVAGLARIDNLGDGPVTFTAFASEHIPITVVDTKDAEEIYEKALGTPVLGVPMSGKERLDQFPPLKSRDFKVIGEGKKYSCSDIVLSAIGWLAVTADRDQVCRLRVHTLNGAGVFLRKPALLPYMVNTKGKRIRDTVAYNKHRPYVPNPMLNY